MGREQSIVQAGAAVGAVVHDAMTAMKLGWDSETPDPTTWRALEARAFAVRARMPADDSAGGVLLGTISHLETLLARRVALESSRLSRLDKLHRRPWRHKRRSFDRAFFADLYPLVDRLAQGKK